MSKKRFTTAIAVIVLLGAMGLFGLYVTLGRMNAVLKSRPNPGATSSEIHIDPADTDAASDASLGMTLTPVGRAQLQQAIKEPSRQDVGLTVVRQGHESGSTAPAGAPATGPPSPPGAGDANAAKAPRPRAEKGRGSASSPPG